jgi:hypothetical protein
MKYSGTGKIPGIFRREGPRLVVQFSAYHFVPSFSFSFFSIPCAHSPSFIIVFSSFFWPLLRYCIVVVVSTLLTLYIYLLHLCIITIVSFMHMPCCVFFSSTHAASCVPSFIVLRGSFRLSLLVLSIFM